MAIKNINCKKNCETGWKIAFDKRQPKGKNMWKFTCECGESFKITVGELK
tara:strand:+ start:193 stop:342 length:150 start_codon:yes stop_codon:yes gene_type:complete